MTRAFVSVGSNIRPARNVRAALRRLGERSGLTAISTVYCTAALGRPEQPPYFNCVAEIETEAAPLEIRRSLRGIEEELGRIRSADKYAARTIDLDLIVYGDLVMDDPDIRLPDPQIVERPFLAIPLLELAPELRLEGFGLRIGEIAAKLPRDGMEPLSEYTGLLRKNVAHTFRR